MIRNAMSIMTMNENRNKNAWQLQSLEQVFPLRENELYIWKTTVSANINNLDDYWSLLTQDEQARAREFYFIKDRNRYVIARAILRKLIASYINIAPKDILFSYAKYGKPYLATENNIHGIEFNLAHSKECIIYGFTKNIEVGVDIEFINKDFAIEDIVKYYCSEEEQHKLQILSGHQKCCYFYKLWVIKEALVKAMGVGLSYDLRQIHINFNKNKLIHPMNIISRNKMYWAISMFNAYDGYYSAFAVKKSIDPLPLKPASL